MPFSRRIFLRRFAAGALMGVPTASFDEPAAAGPPKGPIRLDKNENPFGPSPKARDAMQVSLRLANRYPSGEYDHLTEQIARLHKINSDQVTLGAGSREILRMAVAAYLPAGRKLVLASPTFDVIAHFAQLAGVVDVAAVPLNKRYGHDLDSMLARTDASTGLVYICNPNNPTGTLTPRKDLEVFLSKLPSTTAIVIDEAYHEFVGGTSEYVSFIDHPIDDDRVIVVRTLSKIHGLAGLRLGYSASSAERSRSLSLSRLQWGVSVVATQAAAAALDDSDYVRLSAKRNTDDRQEFYNQANARMLRSVDSVTNFVLLKTQLPAAQVLEHFRNNNVLLGPLVPQMGKYVHVSIGTPEDMREFWRVWDLLPGHGMSM